MTKLQKRAWAHAANISSFRLCHSSSLRHSEFVIPMPTATTDTNPPRVLLLMGVSGCGKTTVGKALAEKLGCPFTDADDLHPPANKAKMSAKIPLTDDDRWPWLRRVREVMDATPPGQQRIVACSALKRAYRRMLMEGAEGVRLIYLRGSFDLIAARLAARKGHFMPPDLLRSQFAVLEEPSAGEGVSVDISLEPSALAEACLTAAGGLTKDADLPPPKMNSGTPD
jgi:gluconokinase